MVVSAGYEDRILNEDEIRDLVLRSTTDLPIDRKRIIVIIPDATRTAPIPMMVRVLRETIGLRADVLDFLIALGTHQPMSEDAITAHTGITVEDREHLAAAGHTRVFNHRWDIPETFVTLGQISASEMESLTGGILKDAVDVRLNRMVLDYDLIVICGPTFPHEVVGFSGGNKYFFPGIGGAEVINFSHWLGALITSYETIGTKYTPVRNVIDRAALFITTPKLCMSLVVKSGGLAGLFIGSPEEAYSSAADLSAKLHIRWVERPFRSVLSVMPAMYADLWTAAKGMYKLEPAIADGGEVIIYAPHLTEVSYTHGHHLDEIGYHVRDYFLKQWDRFKDYPGGVLAHSTHLRGVGTFDETAQTEHARIRVILATGIPKERCERLNLGYLDPHSIDVNDWADREDEGLLLIPRAGEMLYRVKPRTASAGS